jgi:DNA polymerase III epsilon subunit-like protein
MSRAHGGDNRRMPRAAQTIAVIDFETTGISPGQGASATEIAAVWCGAGASSTAMPA